MREYIKEKVLNYVDLNDLNYHVRLLKRAKQLHENDQSAKLATQNSSQGNLSDDNHSNEEETKNNDNKSELQEL